jgi:hypothetical protein
MTFTPSEQAMWAKDRDEPAPAKDDRDTGGSFALENFKMALAVGVTGEVEPAQDKRLP